MNRIKNIFRPKRPLSKKEINSYLNTDLSEKDKRAIEEGMLASEFEQEAIDGYESDPKAIEHFNKVQQRIDSNIHNSSKVWKTHHTLILITVLIIGGAIITFNQILNNDKPSSSKSSTEKINEKGEDYTLVKELSDQEIDEASLLPVNELVEASDIVLSTPITIDNETNNNTTEMKSEVQELIKMKSIEAAKINVEIPLQNSPISISNISVKYVKELLIVNYKELRPKKITTTEFKLSGLPASSENEFSKTLNDVQTIVKKIPYDEYLIDAMSLFRNNNFKAALKKYKVILEQYPKDLNAFFYGALCYYNINELNSAIEHLNACINHQYNTFYEEANWYKALSLYEQHNTNACSELLNKIILKKGFYAKRAENLLNKL